MKFYLAPMQSVTGYVFRNAYHKHFCPMDKYFTPFISNRKLGQKEKNEILPANNRGMEVVPQILCNDSEVFLEIAKQLEDMGYQSVNFNLGCPSPTVVTKCRGAGLLGEPKRLEALLEEIFSHSPLKISVKTRIGLSEEEEWKRIFEIYCRYPLEELIVHPRLQEDQYKNEPRWDVFGDVLKEAPFPVCYNGDIFSKEKYEELVKQFPALTCVMLGRGMVKNPGLLGEIKKEETLTVSKIKAFHDEILRGYEAILFGDVNVLFKMKEIWGYLGEQFPSEEKILKKIRKSKNLAEYRDLVNRLLSRKENRRTMGGIQ